LVKYHNVTVRVASIMLVILSITAMLEFLSLNPSLASTQLQVTTDKQCYDRGDTVTLTITGNGNVAIEVYGPGQTIVWLDQLNVSGTAVREFVIPLNAQEGTYYVYAAASGQSPTQVAQFLVRRPYFSIVKYSTPVSGESGATVPINVTVANSGSDGYVKVELLNSAGELLANSTVFVPFNESKSLKLSANLPSVSSESTFTWILRAVNVKYGVVDSSVNITVTVTPPPPPTTTTRTVRTTTTYVPPPPPIVTTTTTTSVVTTTTTTPITTRTTTTVITPSPTTTLTTTTTAPPAVSVNLTKYMAPNGTVVKKVQAKLPSGGLLVIEAGTTIQLNGVPVKQLTVSKVVTPPPTPATEVIVGPVYDVEPSGAKLSKPVLIVLPFNPAAIPEGYKPLPAYYDPAKHMWVPVEVVSINYRNGTVVAKITHLSLYSVVAFRVFVVVTFRTTTATKYVTITSTALKPETVSETRTGKVTVATEVTKTVLTTLAPLTKVTIVTAAPQVVTKHVTLTTTKLSRVTSTVTVTRVATVVQESYVYAALAALFVALVILIVASLRGGGVKE